MMGKLKSVKICVHYSSSTLWMGHPQSYSIHMLLLIMGDAALACWGTGCFSVGLAGRQPLC